MAGHSKFANIKHKKERNDAAKGRVFSRIGREIAMAVKMGGGPDPGSNGQLRDAVAKAKSNNMSNDTIDRAIRKAAGDIDSVNYETITYEGYGPSGVAIIVQALTDNRNRAAANVRSAFSKNGGNMGPPNCVVFQFDQKGHILVEKESWDQEDALMDIALEAGAEDFETLEEGYEIITPPEAFSDVTDALDRSMVPMASAEITMIPQLYASLTDAEDIKKMRKLLDMLDADDDVQNVWHNWDESA